MIIFILIVSFKYVRLCLFNFILLMLCLLFANLNLIVDFFILKNHKCGKYKFVWLFSDLFSYLHIFGVSARLEFA